MTEAAEPAVEPAEDAYALDAAVVDAILAAVEVGARERLVALLNPLHDADIADLLEQIDQPLRARLIALWGADIAPYAITELRSGVRDLVVPLLSPEQLARVAEELETDDMVYLVEDLAETDQEKVLDALDDADRMAVERSLTYPEYSAGRLMQRELVSAPEHWTVGEIIDYMRASDDLPDEFYDVIIVDPRHRPVGMVALSKIMANRRETRLDTLMNEDFRIIPADQAQEDVAYAFNQYHLITGPVVDAQGRLVGVITIDDAMEVLEDEAEEDMKLLAGVGDEEIADRVWETARARFPWLAVNICTALIASAVIALFSGTIEAIVALAVLMPIVTSMGGNAGTQSLTVAVRGLATRDITSKNMWRVVRREVIVGVLNGAVFGMLIGAVGFIWFGTPMLGVVLWLAMLLNMLVAGLVGILIPIGLDRAGADPALASGVFVTMSTDVIGFLAFLGLASVMLL
ncbi:magnesium transporter (plasmid) [Paroceanicella profunda]|uniref:Magnesium transporter MgtE n=1 Tax=Paroceanicella profunda TaxID=2579971 RepID=A0A5B8FIU5_9RHOB|nr:magnesium transporter [Paroceanicella profunda]QDL94201.1 magnesium transporter [Paroceanicella profunda]